MIAAAAGWSLAAIAAVGMLAGGVWRIGAKTQRPRLVAITEEPEDAVRWERIRFRSGESELAGWFIEGADGLAAEAGGKLPTVIIAHGWGSNRSRVLRYAKPLYKAGFSVFMYDARSHGESDSVKAPTAFMFRDDLLAAVAAARKLSRVDPEQIAVLGHSLGGVGSVLALQKGLKVKAIVTDSMPVTFETMVDSQLKKKGLPFFPLGYLIPAIWLRRARISRSEARLSNVPDALERYAGNAAEGRTPVLSIHSTGDDFIPANDLRRLERELPPGRIQTLFVNATGHSASQQDEAFWRNVLPFLREHL
ncbi:alpha/beta hydrolase [Paenibacillus sp. NPDC058071]|uniref:alpha/beta hydrolase n=1 Tax=Paenibacillus sp. NPDC058071 TaxID=3346326 RepID=UPI0036D857A5